jgi:transposase
MRHVGIDLGLRGPHRVAVFEDGKQVGRPFRRGAGREGIDALERRAVADDGLPCEFVMEPTGLAWLPLAAELHRRGHRVFVPATGKLAALRKFYSLYAKSDSIDAYAQGMVRHVDPDGTHPLSMPSAESTMLRMMVKQRARLVSDVARSKNRIRGWLVLASPQLDAGLPGDRAFSQAARSFLREHLDPFSVRAGGRQEVELLWSGHDRGNNAQIVDAVWRATCSTCDTYEALRTAGKLPFDYGVLQLLVRNELDRMETTEAEIAGLGGHIERLHTELDPERTLQSEAPGIGPAIAPVLEAFVGPIERFRNIRAFAAYFGFVPRSHQTGGRPGTPQPMTKGGPNLAKQYIYLAAEVARRRDPELAVTYRDALRRGKHHIDAVCVVAHRLLRKIYALLRLREVHRRDRGAPPARWRYVNPETGAHLSRRDAGAWIAEHCPSKAEQQRRDRAIARAADKVAAGTPGSGSPISDATTTQHRPPIGSLPRPTHCGEAVHNPVETPNAGSAHIRAQHLKKSLDGT